MKACIICTLLLTASFCSIGYAKSRRTPEPSLTFGEMEAAHEFPKWATNVCFIEAETNERGVESEIPWNGKDDDSYDFILYGPKGDFHIQTQVYVAGRAVTRNSWNRQRNSPDGSSNFLLVLPGSKHREGVGIFLHLSWIQTQSSTSMKWTSLSSGEPLFQTSGRCRLLKNEKSDVSH